MLYFRRVFLVNFFKPLEKYILMQYNPQLSVIYSERA